MFFDPYVLMTKLRSHWGPGRRAHFTFTHCWVSGLHMYSLINPKCDDVRSKCDDVCMCSALHLAYNRCSLNLLHSVLSRSPMSFLLAPNVSVHYGYSKGPAGCLRMAHEPVSLIPFSLCIRDSRRPSTQVGISPLSPGAAIDL